MTPPHEAPEAGPSGGVPREGIKVSVTAQGLTSPCLILSLKTLVEQDVEEEHSDVDDLEPLDLG